MSINLVFSRAALLTLALCSALFCGCEKAEKAESKAPAGFNSNSSGNPVTAPVDYLGAVAKGYKGTEQKLDLINLNKAIEMFQTEEGRNPKSLNELVETKTLPALPPPPRGMRYDYNPSTGKVKLVPQ